MGHSLAFTPVKPMGRRQKAGSIALEESVERLGATRPLQIFLKQLLSYRRRGHWRPGRAVDAKELLEIPLQGSGLLAQRGVEPFLCRGESRPLGEIGREIHFAPFRMPARTGKLGKRTKECRDESCDSSTGFVRRGCFV